MMGIGNSVHRAFDVLRNGGVAIEAIHELLWSKCCDTIIDKPGLFIKRDKLYFSPFLLYNGIRRGLYE